MEIKIFNIFGLQLYAGEHESFRGGLEHVVKNGWTLAGANLEGANLASANLEGANLVGANLAYANLAHANLAHANLVGARFAYANLAYANLAQANLEGAKLEGANLASANLEGANLEGANLASANLEGANLESANLESLESALVEVKTGLEKTRSVVNRKNDEIQKLITALGYVQKVNWSQVDEIKALEAERASKAPTSIMTQPEALAALTRIAGYEKAMLEIETIVERMLEVKVRAK